MTTLLGLTFAHILTGTYIIHLHRRLNRLEVPATKPLVLDIATESPGEVLARLRARQ